MSLSTPPAYEPDTPFEGTMIAPAPTGGVAAFEGFASRADVESPFLPEYWTAEDGDAASPVTAELVGLLERLWDEEFDELTLRLAHEAATAVDGQLPVRELGGDAAARERFVEGWLAPLREHAEGLVDSVTQAVSQHDAARLSDAQLDEVLDALEVGRTSLPPTMDEWLGKLAKKVKTLAKGAVKIARKGIAAVGKLLPLEVLLGRLKALVAPLLKRVLSTALGKLPANLQPAATQLAKRVLGGGSQEAADDDATEAPATADISVIQQELDLAAASLLFAADETEAELSLAEYAQASRSVDGDEQLRLDAARQNFASEVTQLSPGEDPAIAVQRFLPAILPVAKTTIAIAGRERVIRVLARYLAKLIERYVGPEQSAPLSRAIVDAGLRSISLETPDVEREAAGAALAATIEDTIHGLGELHEDVLDDEELLTHEAYRAFEAAAVANMPPATLQPDLRPGAFLTGTWVMMPADRPAKAFKKYSRVLDARITPQVARQLETFGGTSLETFLFEHHGTSGTIEARAHLYEVIPGTTIERIAALEGEAPTGPDRQDPVAIHPLSTTAAGLLFGEPEIGRDISPAYLADPDHIAVGQRLVALELVGSPPRPATARTRRSNVRATIDLRAAREIRLALYFSEAEAQRLASEINRGAAGTAVQMAIVTAVQPRLAQVMSGRVRRRVRFVADNTPPRHREKWLRRLSVLVPRLEATMESWLRRGIAAHPELPRQFADAAAKDADGVTMIVRFEQVRGLDTVGRVIQLRSKSAKLEDLKLAAPQRTTIELMAGYRP